MAMFPTTTCFYPAIVHQTPQTHLDDYELLFEDNDTNSGYSLPTPIIQGYVIAAKQENKQSWHPDDPNSAISDDQESKDVDMFEIGENS